MDIIFVNHGYGNGDNFLSRSQIGKQKDILKLFN